MPQTSVVGEFMQTLGSFYEIVDEESPIEVAMKSNPDSVPKDLNQNMSSKWEIVGTDILARILQK